MSQYQSDLLRLLDERGYIHQLTDAEGLDALAQRQVVPGYIGFDATAPSLHVGSMVQIMLLRRLQQTGHKPVVLMGGGTTRLFEPSIRQRARSQLASRPMIRASTCFTPSGGYSGWLTSRCVCMAFLACYAPAPNEGAS